MTTVVPHEVYIESDKQKVWRILTVSVLKIIGTFAYMENLGAIR